MNQAFVEATIAKATSLRRAARSLQWDEWAVSEYVKRYGLRRRMRETVERAEQRIAALSPTWDALRLDRELERLALMKKSFLLR